MKVGEILSFPAGTPTAHLLPNTEDGSFSSFFEESSLRSVCVSAYVCLQGKVHTYIQELFLERGSHF